jgi:hypothetical protein
MLIRACLLLFLLAVPAWGQEIPYTIVGKYRDVKVVDELPLNIVVQPGIGFYRWDVPPLVKTNNKGNVLEIISAMPGNLTIKLAVESAVGRYNETTKIVEITYVTKTTEFNFVIGGVPVPPVPPIPPEPKPPIPVPPIPPTPVPVTSFRVVFVTESGKTLPAAQRAVIDAKVTRDYLTANTTPEGGLAGWRQYDPQQNVANEQPNMKKLWEAVQPSLTALPCVVIETNGKADILPLAATPEAQVEVFKQYKAVVK